MYRKTWNDIKNAFSSGLISDVLSGNIKTIQNNTIHKIACIRRYSNNTYETFFTDKLPELLGDHSSLFECFHDFVYVEPDLKKIEQLREKQRNEKIRREINTTKLWTEFFLGSALSATVFISYWYLNQKYINYYTVPDEKIIFPIYPDKNDSASFNLSENNEISTASIVLMKEEDEDNVEYILDVTSIVNELLGPYSDFHGRCTIKQRQEDDCGSMNFGHILDILLLQNKSVRISDLMKPNCKMYLELVYSNEETNLLDFNKN